MNTKPQDPLKIPIQSLPFLTQKQSESLQKAGLKTALDLLLILPLRFEDYSKMTPVAALKPLETAQSVLRVSEKSYNIARKTLRLKAFDDTGEAEVLLFHCYYSIAQKITQGTRLLIRGQSRPGKTLPTFLHPRWKILKEDEPLEAHLQGPSPVYPKLGLKTPLSPILNKALSWLEKEAIPELLPGSSLKHALLALHKPAPDEALDEEKRESHLEALALEELLAERVALRRTNAKQPRAQGPKVNAQKGKEAVAEWLKGLPFEWTTGQKEVFQSLERQFIGHTPKTTLVQGEVGSGKTLLCLASALFMAQSDLQSALICPTTLLAAQHAEVFSRMSGLRVCALTGATPPKEKREVQKRLQSGEPLALIGTHAILSQDWPTEYLGLVMFDEQQRFGVKHRLKLLDRLGKERSVHQIMFTATPIPRSLALALYGEIDYLQLKDMPQGRLRPETRLYRGEKLQELQSAVQRFCEGGGKAYWVCPRIESDEEDPEKSGVLSRHEALQKHMHALPLFLMHGKMSESEKQATLQSFRDAPSGVLVSTSLLEVGIDVKDANLIVIESAERFGLSQLHQLRGRVGRNSSQSYCFLINKSGSLSTHERLSAFKDAKDGFEVASLDLTLRGKGELRGERQSGEESTRIFDFTRHQHLIEALPALLKRLNPEEETLLFERWIADSLELLRA